MVCYEMVWCHMVWYSMIWDVTRFKSHPGYDSYHLYSTFFLSFPLCFPLLYQILRTALLDC